MKNSSANLRTSSCVLAMQLDCTVVVHMYRGFLEHLLSRGNAQMTRSDQLYRVGKVGDINRGIEHLPWIEDKDYRLRFASVRPLPRFRIQI